MWTRASWAVVGSLLWTAAAWSQTVAPAPGGAAASTWRQDAAVVPAAATAAPGALPPAPGAAPVAPAAAALPGPAGTAGTPAAVPAAVARTPIARVSAGNGQLPNSQGQVWREYDITPYTRLVTSTTRPEQAIVDWILRETGYERWHSEPLGILSATRQTLRVYHTPEVQAIVGEIVDRFVSPETQSHGFSLRVVTVESPSWRTRVQRLMSPVPVQTQGVQAWMLEKEGAAFLLADLRRRGDFREHSASNLLVTNAQSTVVFATRGRNYVKSVALRPDAWLGYEAETGLVDEGFSLELSPLLSLDGRWVDATLKCQIDQVEKLLPVYLDVPTQAAPRQRTKLDVPQTVHFRFHERFHWPENQVLVVGMGVVPAPVPSEGKSLVPGLPLPTTPPRADLLVFIESKGKNVPASSPYTARSVQPTADPYRGRR